MIEVCRTKKKVWVQGFSHIMLGLADEPEQKSFHHHDVNRTFKCKATSNSQWIAERSRSLRADVFWLEI